MTTPPAEHGDTPDLTEQEREAIRAAARCLDCGTTAVDDEEPGLYAAVERILADRLSATWAKAAVLADTTITSWQAVPGLHPEAQEPHPAAIAASGARRTLAVLRERMTEAFADRLSARSAATPEVEPVAARRWGKSPWSDPRIQAEVAWPCDWPAPHPAHEWATTDEAGVPYDEWCGGGQ